MIKIEELRVGNYVKYNGFTVAIGGFSPPAPREDEYWSDKWIVELFDGAGTITARLEDISPIELNEDWFNKLKFIVKDKKYSLNYGGESMKFAILEVDVRNPFIVYFHGKFGFNINDGRKNGDYCFNEVHRLQNTYFELTNKELKL